MATRGVAQTVCFLAWDTSANTGKTGDGANFTMRWVKDGTSSALTTTTVTEIDSTNCPGLYKVGISATEADCNVGFLMGKSSTASIKLMPVKLEFERLPNAAPDAAGGVRDTARFGGTTVTARDLGASVLVGDKTGFSLSAGGVQAIWDAAVSGLTTVGSIGKRIVDYLTGDAYTRIGAAGAGLSALGDTRLAYIDAAISTRLASASYSAPPSAASIRAEIDANSTKLDVAVSTRLASASYTAPLDSTATQTAAAAALTAYDPPTNAEMEARTLPAASYATATALATVAGYLDTEIAAILEDTGTTLPAQIAALNNLSAAQVNAEVVDALNVDTYAESTAVPAATASLQAKIAFLATLARNKQTRTSTTATLLRDDGTTAVCTATLSDDGTTFTRTEWV